MMVQSITGNIADHPADNRQHDKLSLHWYETTRRIQRKHTAQGREIALKLFKEGHRLRQGDILYIDDQIIISVDILPCETIVITPRSLLEMGTVCYEIGNKHLPIFIQDDQVLIPAEGPLFRWLHANGYAPVLEQRQLTNMLRSEVTPHAHGSAGSSLFSRIMQIASK
ncbi:urease accessory protein UreE [Chitinophaga pendula]|nr:urease accessory protein UreE [Chitinophaga pendula]